MPKKLEGSGVQVFAQGSALSANNPKGLRSTAIATMQAFADEFPGLLKDNSNMKLPNGLILQWGKTTYAGTGGGMITFPDAFPNACLAITCNVSDGSDNYSFGQAISPNKANFISAIYTAAPGSAPVANSSITVDFYWMAIGY